MPADRNQSTAPMRWNGESTHGKHRVDVKIRVNPKKFSADFCWGYRWGYFSRFSMYVID